MINTGIRFLKRVKNAVFRRIFPSNSLSTNYHILDQAEEQSLQTSGWHQTSVAKRQHQAFEGLLTQMHNGDARLDFKVMAQSVQQTGLQNPTLLEIGCGSGYYSEVLPYLLKEEIRYTGIDFSYAMVSLAHRQYASAKFLQADATQLPFASQSFDIVVNGTALMHITDYERAIAESCRVARSWCIFHTVPVLQQRQTSRLRKEAYGEPVLEIIFNEGELLSLFAKNGLVIQNVLDSIDYNLVQMLQEATTTKTYLCRIKGT